MNRASLKHRLTALFLGPDTSRHKAIGLTLVVSLLYLFHTCLTIVAVHSDHAWPGLGHWLEACLLFGAVFFYGMLRSGLSIHLRDPDMFLAQLLYCIFAACIAYLTVDIRLRGVVLAVLPVVLLPGQFTLTPRALRLVSHVSVSALALAVTLDWLIHPQQMDVVADMAQWAFACVIIAASSWVAQRVSELRLKLTSERESLSSVLDEVQVIAAHDPLTGLINRRRMQELLHNEWIRKDRLRQTTTLVMLDLDHFKRINDEYGHHAGDEVLRNFAELASQTLRQFDVLARWGGEEFLLMYPGTKPEQALIALERMYQRLRAASLLPTYPDVRITCSAGVSCALPGEPYEQAIERADQALYRAKTSGRDRIEVLVPTCLPNPVT